MNKSALMLLDRIGNLDPPEAMTRLRDLHADLRVLQDLIKAADRTAKDLAQAAAALSGEDVQDGHRATETAMMARATLEFLNRLAPDADRSTVTSTITRLQWAAAAMSESADAAHRRAGEIRKHLAHATEAALANPSSDVSALMGRFQASPVTQAQLDKAMAEGRSDQALRLIADEAIKARLNAARSEKRSRAAKIVGEIERVAEATWQ